LWNPKFVYSSRLVHRDLLDKRFFAINLGRFSVPNKRTKEDNQIRANSDPTRLAYQGVDFLAVTSLIGPARQRPTFGHSNYPFEIDSITLPKLLSITPTKLKICIVKQVGS